MSQTNLTDSDDSIERGVEKFGKSWRVRVRVYYTGSRYNVEVHIMEEDAGFFQSADTYSICRNGGKTKENVNERAEELVEKLFDSAKEREDRMNNRNTYYPYHPQYRYA